jgi:hypothetical protein
MFLLHLPQEKPPSYTLEGEWMSFKDIPDVVTNGKFAIAPN